MSQRHIQARITDIADLLRGVTYDKSQSSVEPLPGLVPVLRATNIDQELNFEDLVFVPASCIKEEQFVRPGDLIVAASSGSRSVVGKAAPVRRAWNGAFGAFCFALRPRAALIEPLYLSSYLQTSEYRSEVSQLAAGVNINNLKRDHLQQILVPMFPLAEQRRIVEAIESYFTRLDDAVATLERVQRNLKRYRASVLKAAVEGRLVPTEAELARAEGRDYEPASALLERILAERRRRHEAEGPGKYQEPVPPDISDLPELPEGWAWASVEQFADHRLGKMLDKDKNQGTPHPYLRNANVRWFEFDLADVSEMRVQDAELDEVSVRAGDVVVCEGGEPGRAAVWQREDQPFVIQKALHKVRPAQGVSPWFFAYLLAADAASGRLGQGFTGSTIRHFTGEALRKYCARIPPEVEQPRIVDAVDDALSLIAAAERAVAVAQRRCARLRQSILKWAFEGKLADQDPSDEPASALLERIRSHTAASRQSAGDIHDRPRRRRGRRSSVRAENKP